MVDSVFFKNLGPLTLSEIVTTANLEVSDKVDLTLEVTGIATLQHASSSQLSFFSNSKYLQSFINSKAGFCIINKKFCNNKIPLKMIALFSTNPLESLMRIVTKFYQINQNSRKFVVTNGALISPSAKIGVNCQIGQNVIIEDNVIVGDNVVIEHNSIIKFGVRIDSNATIGSNVTISNSVIGSNTYIHTGCRIGQTGFGFVSSKTGHYRIMHLGRVVIGDDVEIGANTAIDRGSVSDTEIDDMTKIDNLVHIAHNVKIGKNCLILAHAAIAGSTIVGNNTIIGGQTGISGHLNIGNNSSIASKSCVIKDVVDNSIVGGMPAIPIRDWHRQTIMLKRMSKSTG